MEIKLTLNGRAVTASVQADTLLLDFLRSQGCLSVKRGCETANCGLCTVLMDGKPVLSCSVLAARAEQAPAGEDDTAALRAELKKVKAELNRQIQINGAQAARGKKKKGGK